MNTEELEQMTTSEAITHALNNVIEATVLVTCTAYLRVSCKDCINGAVRDIFIEEDFMDKHGPLLASGEEEDFAQFMRQVVIFTKDTAEELCKEECWGVGDD